MTEKNLMLKNKNIPVYNLDALIIGSGCAGFNAADWLYDLGVKNIAMVTEHINCGTSRNTGSDKQTYYKLSVSSSESDSIKEMCNSLFEGKSVNGDTALIEAACSIKCFMKLANLGVPFPTNEFGEYVGYMTDHDIHKRATSAGPLTSKYMTEVLEKSVNQKNIPIFDETVIVKLLTDGNKVFGAIGINRKKLFDDNRGIVIFLSNHIIMATGGPAGIYASSVYPVCHKGMSGLAIEAGAECANLQEWQYGLASVDFRWNVSGTYQQVIPKYISIDENGVEREFLNDYFDNPADAVNLVFKKGYQWPFDSAKVEGSSIIDIIIYNETVNKNRSVYMDFRSEPTVLENGFSPLSKEAYEYLENSDALLEKPINRLAKMNPKAIDLYKKNGIDLYNEPLRVAVCAQHNNGGIDVDMNWQTSIKGLYAAGEVAGTFGVYRPGGSALNSTQVGSMRAAENIALSIKHEEKIELNDIEAMITNAGGDVLDFILSATLEKEYDKNLDDITETYRKSMSDVASYIRIPSEMEKLKTNVIEKYASILNEYQGTAICNVVKLFRVRDMLLTQGAVLSAMIKAGTNIGTRGGSLVRSAELTEKDIAHIKTEKNDEFDQQITITSFNQDELKTEFKPIRPIPDADLWFERVWNDYNNRWGI